MNKPTKPKAEVISNDPKEDIAPISPYGAVEYSSGTKALEELVKQSAGIKKIESTKDVAAVMPLIAALRLVRVTITKERKVLKDGALEHGRLVDSEAAKLVDIIKPEEERLQAIRKVFEDAAALVKQKELEAEKERTDAIKARIAIITNRPGEFINEKASVDLMTAEINRVLELDYSAFEEFEDQARGAADTATAVLGVAVRLAEGQAAQAKIDEEHAAERQRIIDAAAEVEADRLANEKEAERLKQEKATNDQKVIDDNRAAKQKIIDDENTAKQKIIDDKKAADKVEADKKTEAAAEKKRLARIAEMKPDKDKLLTVSKQLRAIELPVLQSQGSKVFVKMIEELINELAVKIESVTDEW